MAPRSTAPTSALIADDEPLLRGRLAPVLQRLWPELQVIGQARSGREAIGRFDEHQPQVCVLGAPMSGLTGLTGLTGLEAARAISSCAHIVFVTAYEQHAVQAFEYGTADCLVKPFDETRLKATVQRLRRGSLPAGAALAPLLDALAARLQPAAARASAMDQSRRGQQRAPDPGGRSDLPAQRRELHAVSPGPVAKR